MDFEIILQECSLVTLYQNSLNGSAPLNKMAASAKNSKNLKQHYLLSHWPNFKIISQECSLGDPLPKLLKPFRLDEQDGCQS